MASQYDDPAYQAARGWEHVTELFEPAELRSALLSLGVGEEDARRDRFKSRDLIERWEATFVARVRAGYGARMPPGVAGTVVRTFERVLEVNLGSWLNVRIRPGLQHADRWCCQIYGDGNTDPQRPWRIAWRFRHEYCFVRADGGGYGLSWADGFSDDVAADARLFRLMHPRIEARNAPFDRRYCKWLAGLLDLARQGFVPYFYGPGYDGKPLSNTPLLGEGSPAWPAPRSPWG
jgi:hypothetical protein